MVIEDIEHADEGGGMRAEVSPQPDLALILTLPNPGRDPHMVPFTLETCNPNLTGPGVTLLGEPLRRAAKEAAINSNRRIHVEAGDFYNKEGTRHT